jgi:hypothetical protein
MIKHILLTIQRYARICPHQLHNLWNKLHHLHTMIHGKSTQYLIPKTDHQT